MIWPSHNRKAEKNSQGFTLVEISVVLVIVGLLVGGVLVGRDLIAQSRLQKFVTEVQQLKSAVARFEGEYNQWPGDMANPSRFWPTAWETNVIQDGYIDLYINCEAYDAWNQLSLSGFWPSNTQNNYTNEPVPGIDVPQSSLAPNVGWMIFSSDAAYNFPSSFRKAHLQIFTQNPYWINRPNGAVFTASEAKYIDQKIDNGNPTGEVLGTTPTGAPTNCFVSSGSTYSYNTASSGPVCSMGFMLE